MKMDFSNKTEQNNDLMTIVFKNGESLIVEKEIAEILSKNIEQGCKQWQIFRDISNNNELKYIINLNEVIYIC